MLIVAVADQYLFAARALRRADRQEIVRLPLINLATVGIELYLKSLNAKSEWSKIGDPLGFRQLHSRALTSGHDLAEQYAVLNHDVRDKLYSAFNEAAQFSMLPWSLKVMLSKLDGVFQKSRYPFEDGNGVDGINVEMLMELAEFLRQFIYDNEDAFYAWSSSG
ncbi:hypothetical protein [Neorhizobium sp. NCHU2750]|uniref:hypothetical protein n=1 Tax=Neorhizobium sp. NCHU2750 TaxID=1825976 RepID=UPI0013C4522D